MSRVMQARIAFAIIGIAIWGYAVSTDNQRLRLVGIGLLALSLVLRFAHRRPRRHTPDDSGPPTA